MPPIEKGGQKIQSLPINCLVRQKIYQQKLSITFFTDIHVHVFLIRFVTIFRGFVTNILGVSGYAFRITCTYIINFLDNSARHRKAARLIS